MSALITSSSHAWWKRLQRKWAKLMEGGITTKRKRNNGTKVVIGGEFPYYTATELEDNLKASIVTALKMRLNPKEYNASGKVVQSLKKEHNALKLVMPRSPKKLKLSKHFGAWARKYDLNCKLVKHVNDKKKTVQYQVQPYQSWFRNQFREFELQKGSNEVLYDIKEYGGYSFVCQVHPRIFVLQFTSNSTTESARRRPTKPRPSFMTQHLPLPNLAPSKILHLSIIYRIPKCHSTLLNVFETKLSPMSP